MAWLGQGLRDNSSLSSIDLSNNMLGADGSNLLGDVLSSNGAVLHVNSSLHYINVARNSITDAGAKRFMQAIQVNGALLEMDLSGNEIEPQLMLDVESWLKINRKLSSLGPSMQKLGQPKGMNEIQAKSVMPDVVIPV